MDGCDGFRLRDGTLLADHLSAYREDQACRDCGKPFPFNPEADRCDACIGEQGNGIPLVDIRGLPLGDPKRKTAYPDEGFPPLGESIRYIHLQSSRWYFDASQPENAEEANRAIGELIQTAETWDKPYSAPYKPFRVVVDNFGGTIIGRRP